MKKCKWTKLFLSNTKKYSVRITLGAATLPRSQCRYIAVTVLCTSFSQCYLFDWHKWESIRSIVLRTVFAETIWMFIVYKHKTIVWILQSFSFTIIRKNSCYMEIHFKFWTWILVDFNLRFWMDNVDFIKF